MDKKFTIKKETVECYKIRGVGNTFDWADITIDARQNTGRIQIASDNGSFQYYWGACGEPFKEFLIGLGKDYAAGKFGESKWFDHDGTIELIKQNIATRAKNEEHKDVLLEELKELEGCDSRESFCFLMHNSTELMKMYDDFPDILEKISPGFEYFWNNIWPVFIEELKKELAVVNL